jgi:hypothetical protein
LRLPRWADMGPQLAAWILSQGEAGGLALRALAG